MQPVGDEQPAQAEDRGTPEQRIDGGGTMDQTYTQAIDVLQNLGVIPEQNNQPPPNNDNRPPPMGFTP